MLYSRTYGVEIEMLVPGMSHQAVAAALTAAGVPCNYVGYSHAVTGAWKIVTDGSVQGGLGTPMELVSPILRGPEGHDQINKVGAVLATLRAAVNRSCGLHVHVEARSLGIAGQRKLAAMYAEFEPVIDSLLPTSRRGTMNPYAGTMTRIDMRRLAAANTQLELINAANTNGRYSKLNFNSLSRYGTVEFRHHSGTVDAVKINKWIVLCLRMVEAASKSSATPLDYTTQPAPATQRPRNRRLAVIYDLMVATASRGISRNEVAAALGRRTMPPLNRILTRGGIPYREVRYGRTARYVLQLPMQVMQVQSNTAVTLTSMLATLEAATDECSFWEQRQAYLRGGSVAQAA